MDRGTTEHAKRRLMAGSTDFRLLGPVEARADGQRLALGGPKQRSILALLLLHAGDTVARDVLVDALWGARPPATAATALHGYVSQLRKVLEPDRRPGESPSLLVTREPGYALLAAPDQVDAGRFERSPREDETAWSKATRRRPRGYSVMRWLYGGDRRSRTSAARSSRHRTLHGSRTSAPSVLEDRIDADLALGRHTAVIGELESLIATEASYASALGGSCMLALYRSGRQADALAAYREARRTLVEEVGIEPGAELRELEARVLAQDPTLDLPRRPIRVPMPTTVAGRRRGSCRHRGRRGSCRHRSSFWSAAEVRTMRRSPWPGTRWPPSTRSRITSWPTCRLVARRQRSRQARAPCGC